MTSVSEVSHVYTQQYEKRTTSSWKVSSRRVPKYTYPKHIIQTPFLSVLSRFGIDFVAKVEDTQPIDQLDAQKAQGKAIFGKGYIISDQLLSEREKAEREKAEREKAEMEEVTAWPLSDRERAIIAQLSQK